MEKLNDFKAALKFTLKWEGGYVNDPKDPGGETKWGISKRAYPNLDIANLTPQQAADIYARDYWDASGCDLFTYPTNVVVFDSAVNCGVLRVRKWVQDLPTPTSPTDLLARRRQHYVDICNKNTNLIRFAKGWWARLADLRKLVDTPLTS